MKGSLFFPILALFLPYPRNHRHSGDLFVPPLSTLYLPQQHCLDLEQKVDVYVFGCTISQRPVIYANTCQGVWMLELSIITAPGNRELVAEITPLTLHIAPMYQHSG